MKPLGIVLVFLCGVAPAYAVQDLTLKDPPALQPLHWCKDSDGHVAPQTDACGSDTTEVSSLSVRKPDGTTTHLPLETNPATESASSNDHDAAVKEPPLVDFWKRMAKWLAFAIVIGLVGKLLLKQSFVLWTILGFVLRIILVALNVMAF